MPRSASKFKQGDLTRAVKGAVAAGVKIAQVEIDASGKIILIAENGNRQPIRPASENEWDSLS